MVRFHFSRFATAMALVVLGGCAPSLPVRLLQKDDSPEAQEVKTRAQMWNRFPPTAVRFSAPSAGLDCTCRPVLGGDLCSGQCKGTFFTWEPASILIEHLAGSTLRRCDPGSATKLPVGGSTCEFAAHTRRRDVEAVVESADSGVVWRTNVRGHLYQIAAHGERIVVTLTTKGDGSIGETILPCPKRNGAPDSPVRCIFVASLDAAGKVLWTRRLGSLRGESDARKDLGTIPTLTFGPDGDVLLSSRHPPRMTVLDTEGNERNRRDIEGVSHLAVVVAGPDGGSLFAVGESADVLRVVSPLPGASLSTAAVSKALPVSVDLAPQSMPLHQALATSDGALWVLFGNRNPAPGAPGLTIAKVAANGQVQFARDLGKHDTGTLAPANDGMWVAVGPASYDTFARLPPEIVRLSTSGEIVARIPFVIAPPLHHSSYPNSARPLLTAIPGSNDFVLAVGESFRPDDWTLVVQRVGPLGELRWSERLDLRNDSFEYAAGLTVLGSGDPIVGLSPHVWGTSPSAIVRLRK